MKTGTGGWKIRITSRSVWDDLFCTFSAVRYGRSRRVESYFRFQERHWVLRDVLDRGEGDTKVVDSYRRRVRDETEVTGGTIKNLLVRTGTGVPETWTGGRRPLRERGLFKDQVKEKGGP